MGIQTANYADTYDEFAAAISWIERLQLDPSRGRVSQYQKDLRYWKDNYQSTPNDELRRRFTDFINTIHDANDLISVYRKFRSTPITKLESIREKLEKSLNGPIKRQDERPGTSTARNFLFEALVAARLHHPEVGIRALLDAKTDTGFKAQNRKVWIECKRITSLNKLEANVRDAAKQLERAFKKHPGSAHRGLVAIDISKLFNDGSKILVKPTENALLSDMRVYSETFIKDHRHKWEKVYRDRDKRIMGTLIRFSTMASVEERNLPTVTDEWTVNPRDHLPQDDHQFLKQIASAVNSEE